MATNKTYTVAGASTLSGKTKIRFANDTMRIKILAKNGHTDVDLIELPHAMSKTEIVAHMRSVGFGAGNAAVQSAMDLILKRNPVEVTPVATVVKTAEAVPA
jgi:hypothetical protein